MPWSPSGERGLSSSGLAEVRLFFFNRSSIEASHKLRDGCHLCLWSTFCSMDISLPIAQNLQALSRPVLLRAGAEPAGAAHRALRVPFGGCDLGAAASAHLARAEPAGASGRSVRGVVHPAGRRRSHGQCWPPLSRALYSCPRASKITSYCTNLRAVEQWLDSWERHITSSSFSEYHCICNANNCRAIPGIFARFNWSVFAYVGPNIPHFSRNSFEILVYQPTENHSLICVLKRSDDCCDWNRQTTEIDILAFWPSTRYTLQWKEFAVCNAMLAWEDICSKARQSVRVPAEEPILWLAARACCARRFRCRSRWTSATASASAGRPAALRPSAPRPRSARTRTSARRRPRSWAGPQPTYPRSAASSRSASVTVRLSPCAVWLAVNCVWCYSSSWYLPVSLWYEPPLAINWSCMTFSWSKL